MATLADSAIAEFGPVTADFPASTGARAAASPARSLFDSIDAPFAHERGSYRASRRARPVALIASGAAILGIVAAMATLNIVAQHKERARLTTVDVRELDVTPPPPPPEQTKLDVPEAAQTQTVAPRPMIELPSQGPVQVVVDAPPPPVPPVVTSEGTKTVVAPAAAAPPAATTLEGGDLSSKVLFAKPPTYPTDARRAHEQGTVKLLVLVGTDGTVSDIKVAGSSGSSRLDRAALQAVRRWRWSPTMSGGIATAVRGYVTIPFVLVAKA